jgi:hypothetical protein
MDGSNYRVPDTRGVFMRGIDPVATRDINRPAGSIQLDTLAYDGGNANEIGAVIYFAAIKPPTNWLACDGSLYQINLYQPLYNVIGNLYGGVSGSTFAVPDLRGQFIRGLNRSSSGPDPNRALSGTPQEATYVFQYSYGHGNNRGDGNAVWDYPDTNTLSALNVEQSGGSVVVRNGGNYGWGGVPASTGTYKSIRPQNIALLPCIRYR